MDGQYGQLSARVQLESAQQVSKQLSYNYHLSYPNADSSSVIIFRSEAHVLEDCFVVQELEYAMSVYEVKHNQYFFYKELVFLL